MATKEKGNVPPKEERGYVVVGGIKLDEVHGYLNDKLLMMIQLFVFVKSKTNGDS